MQALEIGVEIIEQSLMGHSQKAADEVSELIVSRSSLSQMVCKRLYMYFCPCGEPSRLDGLHLIMKSGLFTDNYPLSTSGMYRTPTVH